MITEEIEKSGLWESVTSARFEKLPYCLLLRVSGNLFQRVREICTFYILYVDLFLVFFYITYCFTCFVFVLCTLNFNIVPVFLFTCSSIYVIIFFRSYFLIYPNYIYLTPLAGPHSEGRTLGSAYTLLIISLHLHLSCKVVFWVSLPFHPLSLFFPPLC